QTTQEYAVLDRVHLSDSVVGLRWGGAAGTYADFERGCFHLAPGAEHTFGVTRISAFTGDMTQGFYTFRAEMEARGHGAPVDFNPPVHWNELYDNSLFFNGTFL